MKEAADHQSCAGQEHEGQRDFRDDEHPTQAAVGATRAGVASSLFHRGREIRVRRDERRGEPEHHAAQKREREGEEQDPAVQRQRRLGRKRVRRQRRLQRRQGRVPDSQPQRPARHGQQRAFGQKLAHECQTTCAQRRTNRHLTRPGQSAGQGDVGQVHTADQEHQADRRPQQQQRLPELGPHEHVGV